MEPTSTATDRTNSYRPADPSTENDHSNNSPTRIEKMLPLFSLVYGIFLTITGAYCVIERFQKRQLYIADLKDMHMIDPAIKQGTHIFGQALSNIETPVIKAFTTIVAIQPKYCDAVIRKLSRYILSGIFMASSGILFTAYYFTRKEWVILASSLLSLPSSAIALLAYSIKDPRTLSEITQAKEAIKVVQPFLNSYRA